MKKLLLVSLLFFPSISFSALSAVNTSTSTMTGSSSPLQWNHSVGSGENRGIVVKCAGVSASVTAITVGGTSATLLRSEISGAQRAFIYGLANPASGSQQVSVSYDAGNDSNMNCSAKDFAGMAQTGYLGISTGTYSNGNQYISISSTTGSDGEYLIDALASGAHAAAVPDASQTLDSSIINDTQWTWSGSSSKLVSSAGACTMQWDINWGGGALAVISIKAATGGGSPPAAPSGYGWFR